MDTHDDVVNSQPAAVAGGSDAQRPTGGWGAEPSNTAPHKYIPLSLKILRTAVDSLYLSAKGELYPNWLQELSVLKEKAQSEDISERSQAQLKLGGHLFEVKDRGTQFCPMPSSGWSITPCVMTSRPATSSPTSTACASRWRESLISSSRRYAIIRRQKFTPCAW